MGLINTLSLGTLDDDIIGDITGSNAADAIGDATADSVAVQQAGLDELIRQFNIAQENIDPIIDAGTGALGAVQDSATPQGLDALLAQLVGTDTFNTLRDERERSVTGAVASSGFSRGGAGFEKIADVPSDLLLQLESMLTGRQTNLATMGANAAVGAGTLASQNASTINAANTNIANTGLQGALSQQQAQAAGTQNILNSGLLAASVFSDPELKENIRKVGEVGPMNLYEWDWRPEFEGTMVWESPKIGFLSTDVREHYPEYVNKFGGFDVIRYDLLIEELKHG